MAQDYPDYEYCIIDGASIDGTIELVNKYSGDIDIFVSEPDLGIYDAMNKALSIISGDVVIFINSGDWLYDKNALSRVMNQFDDNTDVLIAREIIEGKICESYEFSKHKSIYIDVFFPHQATISRVSLYKNDGKFNQLYHICADYDWILHEYYLGRKIKWVDDVISEYNADGISSSVKCTAEQYNISKKYLQMTNSDELMNYLDVYYSDLYRKVFFRRLIKENVTDSLVLKSLSDFIGDKNICIWGLGVIGKALCSFFMKNNIEIKYIIDNNFNNQSYYEGIKVISYKESIDDYIIISSEYFEEEISYQLENFGKIKGKDYITYTDFSSAVVKSLIKLGYDDQSFKDYTGLDVLRYI